VAELFELVDESAGAVFGGAAALGLRPVEHPPVDGSARVGAGQRGDRVLALHRGVRAAPTAALRKQGAARTAVAAWIEEYNHDRRHSALGMLSPITYELALRRTTDDDPPEQTA
jgi:transposase InsO family protein